MSRLIIVSLFTGALLAAPAALAQQGGNAPNGKENGGNAKGGAPSHLSGANAMSRGTSGNSGAGASRMGGSNSMSGSGKTGNR